MINNTDRIHEDLENVYREGAKAAGTVLEAISEAIKKAKQAKDLETLEVSQENGAIGKKPLSLDDLTIESNTDTPKLALDDLTIEQNDRKRKVKEADAPSIPDSEKKILFGMSEKGFVNNLSSEQENAVGRMLMGKPGTEIPGSENLVIKYKGEIIASTNDKGVLEANELYGKIPPETLKRLAEKIGETAYANAPERKSDTPAIEAPITPSEVGQKLQEDKSTPKPNNPQVDQESKTSTSPIQPMGRVPDELRIPRPIRKTSVPSGNPIEQVQNALSAVAVAGNGVSTLADGIKAAGAEAVRQAVNPLGIDPKSVLGVAAISTGKAAGIMNWIESNSRDGQLAISPNGYVGEITSDHNNDKVYTLKDPKGKVVLEGTETLQLNLAEGTKYPIVQMETYDSKGIGKEWETIKKLKPTPQQEAAVETPVVEVAASEIGKDISPEGLMTLKNIADKYVVKEGIDKELTDLDSNGVLLGYEKLSEGKTEYSLYDQKDPYAKVSFTYDEKDGSIQDVKQTTTPSMLGLVEKANSYMRQENIEVKDAADKVNVAEDREPGSQSVTPNVKLGSEIPLSSVPAPTTQAPEATAKLSQQQITMVSKSIAIVNATCLDQDNREMDLEHTRVSIEDKDKNTKVYTIQDLDTKEETQFSHNDKTGEVVVHKESNTVTKLIDREEQIFAPVIPGYPEIVKTTSKQIEKGGEMTLSKGKGEITRSSLKLKNKQIER